MEIAIERVGDRGGWACKRSHLANHREDSWKGVGGVRLEGDMENRSVVDDFMDSFEVVATYGRSAWCSGTGRWKRM